MENEENKVEETNPVAGGEAPAEATPAETAPEAEATPETEQPATGDAPASAE